MVRMVASTGCDLVNMFVGRSQRRAAERPWRGYRERTQAAQMAKQFDVVVERDSEGFYVASVPALAGCHTQARSLDELMARIREAIELCLEIQDGVIEQLDFVGVQRVTV